MENNNIYGAPTLKFQKVKGVYVVPLFLVGLGVCFINLIIGSLIGLVAIGLFLYYRNNADNQSAIYYNQGIQYLAKRNRVAAKNFLNKSVSLNRGNLEAFLALASIYYSEKDYGRALLNFKNGKVEMVENDHMSYILAECYYNVGEYTKAIEKVENITLKNDYVEALRSMLVGEAYFGLEDYKKAIEQLESTNTKYVDGKKATMRFKYYKAISYIKLGEIEKGKPLLEDLLKIDRYFRDIESYGKELNLI